MSTEIENRVVEMKFNNGAFEQGVSKTMGTLDALKQKLNFTGASKGLNELNAASSKVSLQGIAQGVDEINKKFSTMNIVGVAALVNLTNKAVNAGAQMIKSFTIDPITDGFNQYQQQINATQTILGNVSQSGSTLKDVTQTLDVLNDYANKTIYNFSDMATNLGTFTAAGIKLVPASQAIKGISNVAAAAGASTTQAASAMYQLSQGLGRGKIIAQDWMSVVSNGMASASFKNAILETAKAMGTIKMPKTETIEQWTKAGGNFQDAMSKGQITSEVMITTLQAMTGDMTDAQLAAKGYSKEQIKSLQAMAKQANAAAQNVKTVHALVDNLRQGVGSSYAQIFKTLMGDLPTATTNLTKLSGVLNHIFVDPVDHLNAMLKLSKHWGSDVNLYRAIKNIFQALANVMGPIKDAFREVFPPTTGRKIASLAIKLRKFTETLIANKDTMENIKKTFVGVFTVFKVLVGLVFGAVKGVFNLLQVVGQAVPGILALTGAAGQFVQTLAKWLIFKNPISKLFTGINAARTAVLMPLVHFLSQVAEALAALLEGDYSGFSKKFNAAFGTLGDVVSAVRDVIVDKVQSILDSLGGVGDFLSKFGSKAADSTNGFIQSIGELAVKIGTFFGSIGSTTGKAVIDTIDNIASSVKDMVTSISFDNFKFSFGGLKTGASEGTKQLSKLTVVGTAFKNVWQGLVNAFNKVSEIVGPVVSNVGAILKIILVKIKEYISGLDFQDALALINTGVLIALYKTFKDFLGSFGGLFDSIGNTFDTLSGSLKTLQQNVKSKIIMRIAVAVGVLAAAVYVLANIDPKRLGIALGGIASLMGVLLAAMAVLNKFSAFKLYGLYKGAAAMLLLAAAILVLAFAVKILAKIDLGALGKAVGAIAALLGALLVFTKFAALEKGGIRAAAGILILSVALVVFAGVLKIYSAMHYKTIHDGMIAVAFSLVLLGLALRAVPMNAAGRAGAILIVSAALVILAGVVRSFAKLPWQKALKAVATLAAIMAIVVLGTNAMEGALPGAAAMLIVAFALKMLGKTVAQLGKMSVWSIIKALLALVGVFIIIAAASVLLSEAVPFIIAFGAALITVGIGLALIGAAFYLAATGFAIFAGVGSAAIAVLTKVLLAFLNLLPVFATQLGLAIIAFAKTLGDGAPKLEQAAVKIAMAFLDGINKIIPKLITVVGNIIIAFINEVVILTPKVVNAGIDILTSFIEGIAARAHRIATAVTDLITAFSKAVGSKENVETLATAAFTTVINFLDGMAAAIDANSEAFGEAGGHMARAIMGGFKNAFGGFLKGLGVPDSVVDTFVPTDIQGTGRGSGTAVAAIGGLIVPKPPPAPKPVVAAPAPPPVVNNPATRNGRLLSNLRTIASVVDNIDTTPTISPVLDLTEFNKGVDAMTDLASKPITTTVSATAATSVASDISANSDTTDLASAPDVNLKLVQNNYSPESLSTAEIYRKTNNQLSLAKRALGLVVPA